MNPSEFLQDAPENFIWPRCPDAAAFCLKQTEDFLSGHAFAAGLARRMRQETSTRFFDWVDHLVLDGSKWDGPALAPLGFKPHREARTQDGFQAFGHPEAQLPGIVLGPKTLGMTCAIKVDLIRDFQTAMGLGQPVLGAPLGGYRSMALEEGSHTLLVVERRGCRDLVPDNQDRAGPLLRALEAWTNRARLCDNADLGMSQTADLARSLVDELGPDLAAWVFGAGERAYWQGRNRAARIQKFRQDSLGLGWANHDHHTFRSSRRQFAGLIRILAIFGFKRRERYWTGAEAGWGAQIMEQPQAGLVVFADVDLAPGEVDIDFSRHPLPELAKPGTVGLWCALHGDSILESGMHHLEAQFDFDHLRDSLATQGLKMMAPFSDFPFLRQAFTEGERWPVPGPRAEALRRSGAISPEACARFIADGAIGSHLENLQRSEGFKGFNRQSVSKIILQVNPERQALEGTRGGA